MEPDVLLLASVVQVHVTGGSCFNKCRASTWNRRFFYSACVLHRNGTGGYYLKGTAPWYGDGSNVLHQGALYSFTPSLCFPFLTFPGAYCFRQASSCHDWVLLLGFFIISSSSNNHHETASDGLHEHSLFWSWSMSFIKYLVCKQASRKKEEPVVVVVGVIAQF